MATLNYDDETSSLIPEQISFGIVFNTLISTSPLSGVIQSVELPGARWRIVMSFTDLTPAESANLKKFLLKLRGMSGRFAVKDYSHTNADPLTGTVTVSSTSGTTQVTFGGISGGALSVGDYFTIGNDDSRELKMVTDDGGGQSGASQTYTFEPPLRVTTANNYDGKTVITDDPEAVMILTTDDQAYWAVANKAKLANVTLEAIEALGEA